MTYQYLTVDMCEKAKSNGGFVDQTTFKTTKTYGFDSFILDVKSIALIDEYIKYIRPLLNPLCDFLLVNRNGSQFSKLTDIGLQMILYRMTNLHHTMRHKMLRILLTLCLRRVQCQARSFVIHLGRLLRNI